MILSSSSVHIDGTTVNKNSVLQSPKIQYSGIFVGDGYGIVINNTICMYNNQCGIIFENVAASQIEIPLHLTT